MGTGKGPKRILVVEDDGIFRNLLVTALRASGYEALGAENGAVGLEQAGKARPDLILLDIRMPVMDGLMFLRILRGDRGARMPVVVLTCLDSRSMNVRALVAGASEVLVKPVPLATLREKIESALEREVPAAQPG